MQIKDVLIARPSDTIPLIKGYANKKQEHFGILCINGGQKTISRDLLFIGGATSCKIDKTVLFWKIVRREPVGVVLFHNHPSANTSPSPEDIETTREIFKGLKLLGIQLFDHVIIGKNNYFSFLEHDILPKDDE